MLISFSYILKLKLQRFCVLLILVLCRTLLVPLKCPYKHVSVYAKQMHRHLFVLLIHFTAMFYFWLLFYTWIMKKKTLFRLTIIKCYMSWITDNIEAINNHSCMWQSHIITPSLAFCSIMLLFCLFYFYLTVWAIKLNWGVSVFMVCFICEPYNVTNVNVQIDWFSCSAFPPSAVNNISH